MGVSGGNRVSRRWFLGGLAAAPVVVAAGPLLPVAEAAVAAEVVPIVRGPVFATTSCLHLLSCSTSGTQIIGQR
jgi:hypothetical protein